MDIDDGSGWARVHVQGGSHGRSRRQVSKSGWLRLALAEREMCSWEQGCQVVTGVASQAARQGGERGGWMAHH
ncbi:hypothetical protein C5B77_22710 [Aeromonas salmonicida]|nr:hypothetical protein C5B77_22710 [Aeromonas salmonicida]